ncbi:MAG TPA: cyclase dehydrase [Methylobacterium sp.]|jgi:hypothetical protein
MRYEGPQSRRRGHPATGTDALARGLGVFSIVLGTIELLAPRFLARNLGMRGQEGLIQAYGLREIGTGVGLLAADDPMPWVWGRVGGDALDLATLAAAYPDNPKKDNLLIAVAAVAGVTALDVICAERLTNETREPLPPLRNYAKRNGFPSGIAAVHGAAKNVAGREHFVTPELLRPWAA